MTDSIFWTWLMPKNCAPRRLAVFRLDMPRNVTSFWAELNQKETIWCNPQDPDEHEDSSHDADSNPSFDEVPIDESEDHLEPRIGKAQSRRRVGSNWNQAVVYTGKSQECLPYATKVAGQSLSPTGTQRYQPSRKGSGRKDHNDLTNDMTLPQDGSKWVSMESDVLSSRLKQPTRLTTPFTTTTTTLPTTQEQHKVQNDNDTPLILFPHHRQMNLRNTQATTAHRPTKTTNRVLFTTHSTHSF